MGISTHAGRGVMEIVTSRFAFRASGAAFSFLQRNPWFVRYVFFIYVIWIFRKPLNAFFGWVIERLPEEQVRAVRGG
ncbi:hypothetical protein GF367_03595 [Candidatus Woesearchaeota archaeon]|nr:hypothetical protein [Candidatus Woesearchaeota archaeon]